MPLKAGKSKDVVSGNIEEMVRAYGSKGTIGKTRPRNRHHARLIAIAAAMNHAGLGRSNAKEKK